MRVFTTLCKDNKTGYQMILSECSYNMAMDWLERKCLKNGCTFSTVQTYVYNLVAVAVLDRNGVPVRIFYYDEERGYLLGE